MDTIASLIYFGTVLGALPAFVLLECWAIVRFSGWTRIFVVLPAAHIGWRLFDEFAPVLSQWRDMETSELRRYLYERWSAVVPSALAASVAVLLVISLPRLKRLLRRPRTR